MKKRICIMMALALATIGILSGCGKQPAKQESGASKESQVTSSKDSGKAASEEKQTSSNTEEGKTSFASEVKEMELKVAYMPNYGSLWAIQNAVDEGYMADEKIKVNLVEFQDGPTIIAAMESGSIDIGYIGQGAHKLCINGKAKVFALSHISNGEALIGGKGITKIEDIKGKKVAYSSGTSSEDILRNSLDKVGLKMEDVEAMDMDASAIVTAMLSGSVDACATWSPNTLKILDEMPDSTKLADNMTFADKTVALGSWIVKPEYAAQNKDIILRFTRALFKAMDYAANDHFEETAEIIAKQIAQEKDVVYAQRADAKWFTGREVADGAADGTVEKYYELQKKQFVSTGAVEVDPPISDYVMIDNMIEAGKY